MVDSETVATKSLDDNPTEEIIKKGYKIFMRKNGNFYVKIDDGFFDSFYLETDNECT